MVRSRAPGRVNLLGEHTDYNDGFVLPCAIACDTAVRAVARDDAAVCARSDHGATALFELARLPGEPRGDWSDYLRGVLTELRNAGVALRGCDVDVRGNVPLGAGLSSSASLEVAFALAMLALAQTDMPARELALLAQRAEVDYAGTRCGIMDQFTVLHARAGFVLFLDTRSLDYEPIAFPGGSAVVICNTMVRHALSAGAYNERRTQCDQAVAILRRRYPQVRALRDVTPEELERARDLLPAPLFARARHVVSENARVRRAAEALQNGDVRVLGELMYASHGSLREDYEVTCEELDLMVDLARDFPDVIGARMTGGGFGGCTVNLVPRERREAFVEHMRRGYRRTTGKTPEIYDGTPSDGACVRDA